MAAYTRLRMAANRNPLATDDVHPAILAIAAGYSQRVAVVKLAAVTAHGVTTHLPNRENRSPPHQPDLIVKDMGKLAGLLT